MEKKMMILFNKKNETYIPATSLDILDDFSVAGGSG